MVLRVCYAVSGTDVHYATTARLWLYIRPSSVVPALAESVQKFEQSKTKIVVGRSAPLPAYALAMRCPVLTYRLRARYDMSGTDLAYAATTATRRPLKYYGAVIRSAPLSSYGPTMRCPVSVATEIKHTKQTSWGHSYFLPHELVFDVLCGSIPATTLRIPYEMSGTEVGYAATCLRAPYDKSGIEVGYAATRLKAPFSAKDVYSALCRLAQRPGSLRYRPTRLLCDVRY
eukprot:2238658-Rhodomonas_salina.3